MPRLLGQVKRLSTAYQAVMNLAARHNNAASPHEPNSTIAINLDGLKSKVVGGKGGRRVSRLIGSAPLVACPTG